MTVRTAPRTRWRSSGGVFGAPVVPLGVDEFGQSGIARRLYAYPASTPTKSSTRRSLALDLEAHLMGDGTTATLTEAPEDVPRRAAARDRGHDHARRPPAADPNWYLWDGERLWVSTLGWTVKVKNAKRDPRVTLCIDGPSRRTNYVQVVRHGRNRRGRRPRADARPHPQVRTDRGRCPEALEDIKEGRVLIVVTPERFQWRYDD